MIFLFLFKFKWNILQANNGDPDQTQRFVASGLDLYHLPTSFSPTKGRYAYMG